MNGMLRSIIILSFVCFFADARNVSLDRILDFKSAITVLPDARLRVHETITMFLPYGGHGIYRDFPTEYRDRFGTNRSVAFIVEKVQQDGADVLFQVQSLLNGKRIKIGDPHILLPSGTYVYSITYITDWQIGFFKNHDELYWNVTGNGWPMVIERASAEVILPQAVNAHDITFEAYTGYDGQKGNYYKAERINDTTVAWQTTYPLLPEQGLTIVLTWPKGIIPEPTWLQKLHYFIRSNLDILWLVLGLLVLLAYFLYWYLRIHREQNKGTVIPLFYPPHDWTPGEIRYFSQHGYDDKAFAAEIINMAVHGYLTIESKQEFLSRSYLLHKKESSVYANATPDKPDDQWVAHYQPLQDILFAKKSSLEIKSKNFYTINAAISAVKNYFARTINEYFKYHEILIVLAILIGLAAIGGAFYLAGGLTVPIIMGIIIAIVLIVLLFFAVRGYTPEGVQRKNEIEGFKLFLATTETDRLAVIGTPPTKTPELYEKYLPYAVALGVEKQWSTQFAPIFARFEQEGHPYVPVWYVGRLHGFSPGSFATNLGNSLSSSIGNSAISSSRRAPGFSSGAGGRGSSGGGGGGGGGGSW